MHFGRGMSRRNGARYSENEVQDTQTGGPWDALQTDRGPRGASISITKLEVVTFAFATLNSMIYACTRNSHFGTTNGGSFVSSCEGCMGVCVRSAGPSAASMDSIVALSGSACAGV